MGTGVSIELTGDVAPHAARATGMGVGVGTGVGVETGVEVAVGTGVGVRVGVGLMVGIDVGIGALHPATKNARASGDRRSHSNRRFPILVFMGLPLLKW